MQMKSSASRLRSLTWPIISSRSEEHTSELQSQSNLVCRLLLEKKTSSLGQMLESASHAPAFASQLPQNPLCVPLKDAAHIINLRSHFSVTRQGFFWSGARFDVP